jgi:LysR family glycine cleavage system transcriptional activator
MIYAQLPPLNSLKAFDAVVRHGSISEAARILFVSQSAISRHILKLEEFLGSRLLHRGKHGAKTTKEGQEYFDQISPSLNNILDATVNLRATQSGVNIVKISSLSSFALKWLVPKLNKFQSIYPEIVLDISISDECPDFEISQKDCAIVSRPHHLFDSDIDELFEEKLIVVASPSILKNISFEDYNPLNTLPLIHTTSRPELWNDWNTEYNLLNNNFHKNKTTVGLTFQDFYISIAACVAGSGIAIVPSFLVQEEITNKTLIQPITNSLKTGRYYGLVVSSSRKKSDAVITLKKWLIQETFNETPNL